MRLSLRKLGDLHFGNLHKQYGEYRFAIAPNEQKTWKGFFQSAIVNVFKEYVWRSWYFYVPSGTTMYLTYIWAKKANYEFNRKDPKEFENDN